MDLHVMAGYSAVFGGYVAQSTTVMSGLRLRFGLIYMG